VDVAVVKSAGDRTPDRIRRPLTTSAGSLPKPAALRAARFGHAQGLVDAAALRAAEGKARRAAIAMQEAAGIDLLVDGQVDRGDLVADFMESLEGVERGELVRCHGNRYVRRPRIVGAPARRGPFGVGNWQATALLTERPVKATVTGPYTLAAWSFDEHFDSRLDCAAALARIVRDEIADLIAAGVTELQLDEPALTTWPEETGAAAEAIATALEPARGVARRWLRVAYGDYERSLPALLGLPVDGLMIDLVHASDALLAELAGLGESQTLVAGVIDASRVDEDEAMVLARVERVARVVPVERLGIAPDAGLGGVRAEPAERALRLLVAVAEALGD